MDPPTEPDGLPQLDAGNGSGAVGAKGSRGGGKFRLKANLRHWAEN
jgi:hypothetical protein